jgi:hypothetical protein
VSDQAWQNHLFGLHSVVFELCSVVTGDSLLDLMRAAAAARAVE